MGGSSGWINWWDAVLRVFLLGVSPGNFWIPRMQKKPFEAILQCKISLFVGVKKLLEEKVTINFMLLNVFEHKPEVSMSC